VFPSVAYACINSNIIMWQRYAMDAAFYMAKELLMTERTYKKDLEVIAVVRYSHIHHSCGLADLSTVLSKKQAGNDLNPVLFSV